jgi:hypothetical protein
MSYISATTPGGYTIFCDDVRVEANGKQMYIGVYQSDMLLSAPVYPVRIPNLNILVNYRERRGDSEHSVKFCVFMPGLDEPVAQTELPREHITATPPPKPDEGYEDPMIGFSMHFVIRDAILTQDGFIKVRAYLGDDIIRLGSLRIKLLPTLQTAETKEAAN